ncbi:MAG: hypothetical protein P4L76_05740 [Beijerinckiaceae bacterium]|nr:hypothetical protein [Beijerinckiaceae bacterium]
MSIADHFQQISDAGFVRKYDPNSARRQFSASIMLIVAIALAASALCVLVKFDQSTTVASAPEVVTPYYAGALQR